MDKIMNEPDCRPEITEGLDCCQASCTTEDYCKAEPEDCGVCMEMPRYKSHKEVWALKIEAVVRDGDGEDRESNGSAVIHPEEIGFAPFRVSVEYMHKHKPHAGGYYVVYKDGYESFSPAKAFEEGNTPIRPGVKTFGEAIEALKQGNKVARRGWNEKGMYLTLIQGYPVNGHLHPDSVQADVSDTDPSPRDPNPDGSKNITQGKPGQMLPHIVMKTAGDSYYWGPGYSDYVPWLTSQTDMLAEDWTIL